MPKSQLHELEIAEAAALLETKALSPRELLDGCLRQIGHYDPILRAFITVTAEQAFSAARAAEAEIAAGRYRGPLHGIPFGLKDIFATAGIATTGNSRRAAGNIPAGDATTVEKLYAAGGVLLGKMATWEFAHGVPDEDSPWPSPRNPWDLSRATGGSSSGSAAAVAAFLLPFTLGSDTGGSVRGPAALTGTVGLKPTYGLVSRAGVIPNSFSFDHCGPFTRSIEDCAIVLQAIVGHDPRDPGSIRAPACDYRAEIGRSAAGVRIGVVDWSDDISASDEARKSLAEAIVILRDMGAQVVPATLPPAQRFYDVKTIIAETEIFCVHQKAMSEELELFGRDFLCRTLAGGLFTAADYVNAQRERRRLIVMAQSAYKACDILLTVGAGPAPPLHVAGTQDYRFKWSRPNPYTPFNLLGGPAISVVSGFTDDGLPLAIQLAAAPFREGILLRVAAAFEAAAGLRGRRPELVSVLAPRRPSAFSAGSDDVPAAVRDDVKRLQGRAGIKLPEDIHESICQVAPFVFAMASRVAAAEDWSAEPASLFDVTR